jgi:hypothetical protein
MEAVILSDKNVFPADELIFSLIGDKKALWQELMKYVSENYEGSAGEWNYYNDGKSWLFKMVMKKKTLFWIGLTEKTFRVTFWFSDKAENMINTSNLQEEIKSGFATSKKYGAVRGVSIIMNEKSDLENVITLTAIKKRVL